MPDTLFRQVDVFSIEALKGNPLAVVIDAEQFTDRQMAELASWTNLSETTFLLPPNDPAADYKVRIFTPTRELPFTGHPTLGSCHVWLGSGQPQNSDYVVQECGVGLIRIRTDNGRLAFAAPPLSRTSAVEATIVDQIAGGLGLQHDEILGCEWIDNGPGWIGVQLASGSRVLEIAPDYAALQGLKLGLIGAYDKPVDGQNPQFEVRAFVAGRNVKDPATGSLNASLAQWPIAAGLAPSSYVANQGAALGRRGRIHVDEVGDDIWVASHVTTCIEGQISI